MKKRRVWFLVLPFVLLLLSLSILFIPRITPARQEIVITMPYTENIRNIDTNYYKLWLEEQTGLSIRFNTARDIQSADYLRSMFSSGYVKSDAFFSILDGESDAEWNAVLQEFGEKGYILPLNEYVGASTHLNGIFSQFTDYDLRAAMTSADGNLYYMPGFDPSIPQSHFQIAWLNEGWLKKLGLRIPQTTAELKSVLHAFQTKDPNGNGIADEIPLAGSNDIASEQVYNFIINAFVRNDPNTYRFFIEDGTVRFAPMTEEWRTAMQYLNGLYADGLIDPFSFNHATLVSLANDAWNMLGGFASQSITDVLFQSNHERINDFTHIAPLKGPDGKRNATVRTPQLRPGGVITSVCENPEAVFRLFDLMLSEEAFLIGRYGEEGVDWIKGGAMDIDFYGNSAAVHVINQLSGLSQNKHICETGPFFAYPAYADSLTLFGFEIRQEYVDAKAYQAYAPFKPQKQLQIPFLNNHLFKSIDAYTEKSIRCFMTGEKNPYNDADWAAHLQEYQELGIEHLLDDIKEGQP